MLKRVWSVAAVCFVCLCLTCPGCSSSGGENPSIKSMPAAGDAPFPEELATGTGALPELTQIIDAVKTPSHVINWRNGTDYEPQLPNARLSELNKIAVSYAPSGDSATGIAYGIYSFNLGGLASATFTTIWYSCPQSSGESNFYFGISNFTKGRWDWQKAEFSESVNIPDASQYQQTDGLCLVAAVLAGTRELKLYDIGFAADGLYDEIEPNNSLEQAQLLPVIPVYAFSGSLGNSIAYRAGYDGGQTDYFEINAADGDMFSIGVLPTSYLMASSSESLQITNADGEVFSCELSWDSMAFAKGITYVQDKAPYILKLSAYYTDYEIYIIYGSSGEAPEAALSVSPRAGPAPLVVALDASASYDPNPGGSIVRYDWDFESDGIWDLVGGTSATVEHTYETDGVYYPRVRVGNELGLGRQDAVYSNSVSPGRCTVTVGESQYDEVEDNDCLLVDEYNVLPSIPFEGFRGNVGCWWQDIGPVYDGDWFDYFTFYAEAGIPYSFLDDKFIESIGYTNGYNCAFEIYRLDGSHIKSINGYKKSITFVPKESGIYHLVIGAQSNSASHDYSLRAINKYPPSYFLINSDVDLGVAPLTVHMWANAYDPDSDSLTYGWADGDSYPDVSFGNSSEITMVLSRLGKHCITCFVTDETGLRTIEDKTLYVWPHEYEEREPNNILSEAQVLPSLPLTGYRGSLGGRIDGGYDGRHCDIFQFYSIVESGKTLDITVQYDASEETFSLELLDRNGSCLAECSATDRQAAIQHIIAQGDQQCYKLKLEAEEGHSKPNINYTLTVSVQ